MLTQRPRHLAAQLGAVAIAIVAIILGLNFMMPTTLAGEIHASGALEDWRFQYTIPPADEGGNYIVTYDYPRTSVADIRAATTALNRTAAQLAESGTPFKATLVFARPLSVDQFTAFAHDTGIAPTENILRAIDPARGGVITMGIPADLAHDAQGHLLLDQPAPGGRPLDTDMLARVTAGRHGFHLIGVVSTAVTLDKSTYTKIEHDTRVYAVDVMEQVIIAQIHQAYPFVPVDKVRVRWSMLYPAMEQTGIVPNPENR